MKSVKVFFFLNSLPLVVPAAAHLLAAADVRDRVDDAAVEQADHRQVERRVHRHAVAAVGVLQQRGGAVLLEALPVDHATPAPWCRRARSPTGAR